MISIPATATALAIKIWMIQTGEMQILYGSDQLRHVTTNSVQCECTPREALERMFAGKNVLVWQPSPDSYTLTLEDDYCHPELGSQAPLPPCLRYQRTLVVRN